MRSVATFKKLEDMLTLFHQAGQPGMFFWRQEEDIVIVTSSISDRLLTVCKASLNDFIEWKAEHGHTLTLFEGEIAFCD